MKITETSKVKSRSVSCDGGSPNLAHPKIYLEIPPHGTEITCPYCSKKFLLK